MGAVNLFHKVNLETVNRIEDAPEGDAAWIEKKMISAKGFKKQICLRSVGGDLPFPVAPKVPKSRPAIMSDAQNFLSRSCTTGGMVRSFIAQAKPPEQPAKPDSQSGGRVGEVPTLQI